MERKLIEVDCALPGFPKEDRLNHKRGDKTTNAYCELELCDQVHALGIITGLFLDGQTDQEVGAEGEINNGSC